MLDYFFKFSTVLDVVLKHVVLVSLAVRVVEDDGHVRLDRDAGVVAVCYGVLQDVADASVALAGEGVVGVVFLRNFDFLMPCMFF